MKLTTTSIILGILVHLHMILGQFCWAGEQSLICHTDRIDKKFVIEKKEVTIYNFRGDDHSGRKIASSITKKRSNGFDQIIHFEGNRYQLHIENRYLLNSVDDYISIRSPQGHEIIYPIKCKNRN
jgi:hypothetical protein